MNLPIKFDLGIKVVKVKINALKMFNIKNNKGNNPKLLKP